jgi:hypothetical protein
VQFLLGWTELEAHPPLAFEYQTQLDLHSLGLTACQVLAEMLPVDESNEPFWGEINHLRLTWDRYWALVTPLHDRLMDTFHNGGDWDVLKTECLERNVHGIIAEHLQALRTALLEAGEACILAPAEAGAAGMRPLFIALLLLISSGNSEDRVHGPERWREVSEVLGSEASHAVDSCGPRQGCTISSASTASTAGRATMTCEPMMPAHVQPQQAQSPNPGHRPSNLLPPPRVCLQDVLVATTASPVPKAVTGQFHAPGQYLGVGKGPAAEGGAIGDDLLLRLGHLRDRVDWLAHEMTRLGEKREDKRPSHESNYLHVGPPENVTLD